MGRKGSNLVIFFQEGLKDNKYMNLKRSSAARNAFSLNLPRKSRKLKAEHQHLFKDWYAKKGRLYKDFEDYTQAKGGMEAALRRSMFFERVKPPEKSERDKFIYRILDDHEVKEKKKSVKVDSMKDFTIASVESGYGSLSDSSGNCIGDSDSEQDIVVEPTDASSHVLEVFRDTHGSTAYSKSKVVSLSYENAYDNFSSAEISNGKNSVAYIVGDCPFSLLEQMESHNQVSKASEESQMSEISCTDEVLDCIDELIQQESDCPDSPFYQDVVKDLIEKKWSDLEKMDQHLDNFKELPDLSQDIEMVLNNGAEEITKIKVYELMKTVDLGDVVQLVFQSKWKEICSSAEQRDSKGPLLIIDAETFKMMSRNNCIETKFLDDYLLVFLKPN